MAVLKLQDRPRSRTAVERRRWASRLQRPPTCSVASRPLPGRRVRRGRLPGGRRRPRRAVRARVAGQRGDVPPAAPAPRRARHLPPARPARRRVEQVHRRHAADDRQPHPRRASLDRSARARRRRRRRPRQRRHDRPPRGHRRPPAARPRPHRHRAVDGDQLEVQVVPRRAADARLRRSARLARRPTPTPPQPARARRRLRRPVTARRRVRRVLPPTPAQLPRAP